MALQFSTSKQQLPARAARVSLPVGQSNSTRRTLCTPQARPVHTDGPTVLVGDIGGTNARLALWNAEGPVSSAELFAKVYPTTYESFDAVMRAFLKEAAEVGPAPHGAALAIAGAVSDNRCEMTNVHWVVDGASLSQEFDCKVQLLNDFEAVGYGIPALSETDMVLLTSNKPVPQAPKVVMGPGTGLGAAQLMWDTGLQDYRVWPGEGSHATFAPRGWKQSALAAFAANKLGGHVEIEQVACGSGLELIYEFLLMDEPGNRQGVRMGKVHAKSAPSITKAALSATDPIAMEAVDMFMTIVGAEAGAMALRCLAKGGVYIAGGITPRLLPRLRTSTTGGGALLEGFLSRGVREKFRDILAGLPLAVVTNEKVGQIGARQVAAKLIQTP